MVKNILIFLLLLSVGLIAFDIFGAFTENKELSPTAAYYAENAAHEVGAANLVTAIVVTYRGLDTLGEVSILFLTAAIISFMLKFRKEEEMEASDLRPASELFITATQVFTPIILIMGIYIFLNGHLTPGGGFQGGAVIASAFLLMLMAKPRLQLSHRVIARVESISGISYVILGVLGIAFAGGFLDNRVLSLGSFGELMSAGIIPFIYSFIGLKVGAELSNIIGTMSNLQKENN